MSKQNTTLSPITTTNTIKQLSNDVKKQHENLRMSHELHAHETNYTHNTLDQHEQELLSLKQTIEQLKQQLQQATLGGGASSALRSGSRSRTQDKHVPTYPMETPPSKQQQRRHFPMYTDNTHSENNEHIGDQHSLAAVSAVASLAVGAQELHAEQIGRPGSGGEGGGGMSKTTFLVQYRVRNADLSSRSTGTQKSIRLAMRELLGPSHGLDDEDIEITLRQGSLIVDARIQMPGGGDEPTLPRQRAVERVFRDTLSVDPVLDEPLVAREDTEEELWRTTRSTSRTAVGPRGSADGSPSGRFAPWVLSTPNFGLPNRLNFEEASSAARATQDQREQKRAEEQLRQPELSPAMLERSQGQEREQANEDRGRQGNWNLVPERQINLSLLRGGQDAQDKISYAERPRGAKDHIKGKGASGRLLVSIMVWAERLGDAQVTNNTLSKLGMREDTTKHLEHALYMFL